MYHLKYTYLYTGLVQNQIKPLKEFGLINMPVMLAAGNGSMYYPLIQDNTDAQNYNRYSYVLNNPTKYTDPSGYAYNGFEASNAAYERMLEQYSYDMVMQQEMDFLSFKEMVKMNENFGGGNGGTGNPSGIEGNGYVENDPIDPPVGVKPIGWATSISEVKPVRTSGVVDNKKQSTVNWYTPAGKINAVFGITASTIEATDGSFRLSTTSKGFNPKYYSKGWTGNQYAKTFNISKIGNSLGKFSLGLGVVMDIRGMMIYKNNPNSPNAVHPAKAGVNTVMGGYGLWVNPIGGSLYFAVDNFYPGGWPGALQNNGNLIEQNQRILGLGWNLYKDF